MRPSAPGKGADPAALAMRIASPIALFLQRGLKQREMRRLRCRPRPARSLDSPFRGARLPKMDDKIAKFRIGQVVRHRIYPFRGVVFDVDPVFNSTEEWWESIPEDVRPRKDQPFYHLLAENESSTYIAYVSEQNLLVDESGEPVQHPHVSDLFGELQAGQYAVLDEMIH